MGAENPKKALQEGVRDSLPKGPVSEGTLVAFVKNAKRMGWTSLEDISDLIEIRNLGNLSLFTPQVIEDLRRASSELKHGETKPSGSYKICPATIIVDGEERRVIKLQKNGRDVGFAPIPSWFANEIIADGFSYGQVAPNKFREALERESSISGKKDVKNAEGMEIINKNLDVIGKLFGSRKKIVMKKGWLFEFQQANAKSGSRPPTIRADR